MKLSVREFDKEYMGSYIQDYKDVGLYEKPKEIPEGYIEKRKILKEKTDKKEILQVKLGHFAEYVLNVLSEYGNPTDISKIKEIKDYRMINGRILSKPNLHFISNSDYEQVKEILKGYPNLESYADDFALMVVYAKNECFCGRKTQDDMFESLIPERERRNVRNFYADLASIDTQNITISYAQKDDKNGKWVNKRMKIESPILQKMMLFQFAKEYYTFVERADEEYFVLEDEVKRCSKTNPQGSLGHVYSKALGALIHIYWNFMENEGLFGNFKTIKEKYLLIGKLLVIAGHTDYTEESKHLGEAEHHYKRLTPYWFWDGGKRKWQGKKKN